MTESMVSTVGEATSSGGRPPRFAFNPAARIVIAVDIGASHGVVALAAVRQAGRDFGTVLATCVNLLNASVIVIGGGMAEAGEHLLAGIREIVYSRSLPLPTAQLHIVQSRAMDRAGVLGAAMMVILFVLSAAQSDNHLAPFATHHG